MILQKLVDFYEHKKEQGEIASYGWERKAIPFFIQINEDGSFSSLIETRADAKHAGRICTIPKTIERSGKNSWQTTFLLWDHIGYVLGLVTDKEKEETVEKQHSSFKQKLDDLPETIKQDIGIQAVITFLDNADFSGIQESEYWGELYKKKPNVTFQLSTSPDSIIADRPIVQQYVTESANTVDKNAIEGKCLVTGNTSALARTHPKIKGVYGAQTSGAAIVSFNDTAYTSFGKKQNYNAPVSQYAAFAYTTALDYLLKRDSIHKLQIGDISTVFWAEKSHPIENALSQLFSINTNAVDSPRDMDSIRHLLTAPKTGAKPILDDNTKFNVLGLSPNASRLSIRFWHHATVKEMAQRVENYFSDIEIQVGKNDLPFPTLRQLLSSLGLEYKLDNVSPVLIGNFLRSVFEGKPYPRSILSTAINRNRAEQTVHRYRAALIKATLKRTYRYEDLTMSLDISRTDPAYRLGRLFAVYEYTQRLTQGKSNLAERYYGGASSSPATVYPMLIKLNHAHLSKLEKNNPGAATNRKKEIGEILDGIDDYNKHLTLEEQGLFSLGYYHQRQATFTKTDNKNTEQGE